MHVSQSVFHTVVNTGFGPELREIHTSNADTGVLSSADLGHSSSPVSCPPTQSCNDKTEKLGLPAKVHIMLMGSEVVRWGRPAP